MIMKAGIAGASFWYERGEAPFPTMLEIEPKFFRTLEECFIEIGEAYKPLARVISAGAYVDKPGAHLLGRAFDLDGIEFEDGQVWAATEQTRLTAAIQGVFMKKFGVVLSWVYDEAHSDHLHIDDWGSPWGFKESPSVVKYVQWVLNLSGVRSPSLKVDGVWGPLTERAFWQHFGRRNEVRHYPTDTEYKTFLGFASQRFFSQMRRESEPARLRDEKTEALELIRDLAMVALREGDRG